MRQAGIYAVAVLALVLVGSSAGSVGAKTPQALYMALLTTSVKSLSLPAPFKYDDAKVGTDQASSNAKSHHVVGEVAISIGSGDAEIDYVIFPTRADAIADWKQANVKAHAKSTLPAPPPLPWPAIIVNTSITGKNVFGKTVTNGATIAAFTSKNVICDVITISTDNETSGDIPGAIALAKFALAHLNAARR